MEPGGGGREGGWREGGGRRGREGGEGGREGGSELLKEEISMQLNCLMRQKVHKTTINHLELIK